MHRWMHRRMWTSGVVDFLWTALDDKGPWSLNMAFCCGSRCNVQRPEQPTNANANANYAQLACINRKRRAENMLQKERQEEATSDIPHTTSRSPLIMAHQESINHKILHVLFLTFFPAFALPPPPPLLIAFLSSSIERSSASITMFTASSKTWSTPRISLLLHSTYVAPIRSATA